MKAQQLLVQLIFSGIVLVVLSACATFTIEEDYWFHPQDVGALSNKALNNALPDSYRIASKTFYGKDGTKLYGLLIESPDADATIFYLGGNTFSIGQFGEATAKHLSALGVNVFIVDYRGYGLSDGEPALDTVKSDALQAYDFVKSLPIGGKPVIVHGFSMGSMIAAYVACNRPVSGLVLESTVTNVPDWADAIIPWYFAPFVSVDIAPALLKENNIRRLQKYDGPLLLLAGEEDETTPVYFSETLLEKSATPRTLKQLIVVPDAGHGAVLYRPASSHVYDVYRAFIQDRVSAMNN